MALSLDNQDISETLRQQRITAKAEQESAKLALSGPSVDERILSHQGHQTDNDQEQQEDEEVAGEEIEGEEEEDNAEGEEEEDNAEGEEEEEGEDDEKDVSEKLNQLKNMVSKLSGGKIDGQSTGNAAASQVTKELLKQSWINLFSTYGLTLIYLNMHAWLGLIEDNKMFCKLGEEFNFPPALRPVASMLEVMAILILDFVVFLLILVIIGFIFMLVQVITNPIEHIKLIWGLFKDFIQLDPI